MAWRQIWRVAGSEPGSPPSFWKVPGNSPNFPGSSPATSPKFFHCGTQQQSRGSQEVSQTCPEVENFLDFSGGQPVSLGSLTPSPDSKKNFSEWWFPHGCPEAKIPRALLSSVCCVGISNHNAQTTVHTAMVRIVDMYRREQGALWRDAYLQQLNSVSSANKKTL